MANKAIDKNYLLQTLRDFNSIILSSLYQKKLTAGDTVELVYDSTTDTDVINTKVPLTVVNGKICVTFDN